MPDTARIIPGPLPLARLDDVQESFLTVACFEERVTINPQAPWSEYVAMRRKVNEMLAKLDGIARQNAIDTAEYAEAVGTLSGMVTA